jgi:hypothetical protein
MSAAISAWAWAFCVNGGNGARVDAEERGNV